MTLVLGVLFVLGCDNTAYSTTSSSKLGNSPALLPAASDEMVVKVAGVLGVGTASGDDGSVNLEHQPGGTAFAVSLQDPGGSGEYIFDSEDLTFSVGETVNFTLTSETEFHTFTIDELDLYETADAGESYEFTITFETAGTYRLYCVPHETLGMIGEVTVQ